MDADFLLIYRMKRSRNSAVTAPLIAIFMPSVLESLNAPWVTRCRISSGGLTAVPQNVRNTAPAVYYCSGI